VRPQCIGATEPWIRPQYNNNNNNSLFAESYNIEDVLDGSGELSQYSKSLRFGWSGDRFLMAARLSAPMTGAHPASCIVGIGFLFRG
jgi:hypothetical protein